MKRIKKQDLFDEHNNDFNSQWLHWEEMPEFKHKIEKCYKQIEVKFDNIEDIQKLSNLMNQELSDKTKSVWYPKRNDDDYSSIRYISDVDETNTPKYPIYIVSKSRFEKRLTSDSLIRMGLKHFIVVEEHQYEDYVSRVDLNYVTVLILDKQYLREYDTCDDLGDTKSKGPGAARNFAWDHSILLGYKRHWVMDDNIQNFYRMNDSKRVIVSSGAIIRAMEDHTDRFENVYMSGPSYRFFNVPSCENPPFWMNTRIYSCNLILNDISHRWRGRYNEDTDLSVRIMKDGFCTIQYNAFMQGKIVTQALGGGNTEEFYAKEGTLPKSKMIEDLHPDVCRVVWRFNRWHHYLDYSKFLKNELIYRKDIKLEDKINNYGMTIEYK